MKAFEKRDSEEPRYTRNGDEENDAGLMKVRAALRSLPNATCPSGFEYRLDRRLKGLEERPPLAARSLTSGWMGVGLGFACAAFIALFAFDFDSTVPVSDSVTNGTHQVASTSPAVELGTASVPQTNLSDEATENLVVNSDTLQQQSDPAHISPDRLLQVSGENQGK